MLGVRANAAFGPERGSCRVELERGTRQDDKAMARRSPPAHRLQAAALRFLVAITAFCLPALPGPAQAEDRSFAVAIADGGVAESDATLRVDEGDAVLLTLTSDKDLQLHLHGYNLELALIAHQPGQLQFTASHSGRFPLEVHGPLENQAHSVVLYLEVYPD